MLNMATRTWSPMALELAGISAGQVPPILPTTATLKLRRTARRTIAHKSSVSVRVSTTTRDSTGNQATTHTTIRLRAPRS